MFEFDAVPLQRVGPIEFGMSRDRVRAVLNSDYREFHKSRNSESTTDDFGFLHVYYDQKGRCIAVELFAECRVSVDAHIVFPASVEEVRQVIPDLVEDMGNYISKVDSVGIYAPDGAPEAILLGREGYYG